MPRLRGSNVQWLPVKECMEEFDLEVFCETGTNTGKGIRHGMAMGAERGYSCDLRSRPIRRGRRKTRGWGDQVQLKQMDSVSFLKWFCQVEKARTFFWLDAHFPTNYRIGGDWDDWPLLDEIRILKESKEGFEKDVIACDDIDCMKDSPPPPPGFPGREALWPTTWKTTQVDVPYSDLTGLFRGTHELEIIWAHPQGRTDVYSPILLARPYGEPDRH